MKLLSIEVLLNRIYAKLDQAIIITLTVKSLKNSFLCFYTAVQKALYFCFLTNLLPVGETAV